MSVDGKYWSIFIILFLKMDTGKLCTFLGVFLLIFKIMFAVHSPFWGAGTCILHTLILLRDVFYIHCVVFKSEWQPFRQKPDSHRVPLRAERHDSAPGSTSILQPPESQIQCPSVLSSVTQLSQPLWASSTACFVSQDS